MPGNTDPRRAGRICVATAAAAAAVIGVFSLSLLWLMWESDRSLPVLGLMAVYGGFALAAAIGVTAAARERLRELKKGEEEDARKY